MRSRDEVTAKGTAHGRTIVLALSLGTFAACVGGTMLGDYLAATSSVSMMLTSPVVTLKKCVVALCLTVPMFLFMATERRSRMKWLRELWELPLEFLGPMLVRATLPELAVIAALAGIGEELFFRGFLQQWLLTHGVLIGVIVPNLAFGLLHWISPAYALCTFCIGLYFSCTLQFLVLVDLPTLVLAHSLYDLVALVCLVHEVRRRNSLTECDAT